MTTKRTGKPPGRPKGRRNEKTLRREQAMEKISEELKRLWPDGFDGNAHALLRAVYRSNAFDLGTRLDAAKCAVRFETPALNSIDHSGSVDLGIGDRLDRALGNLSPLPTQERR